MDKIPVVDIAALQERDMQQAVANAARLEAKVDTVALKVAFRTAADLNIPVRAKLRRFYEAADALCAAVLPYSACKQGCSHCCNMAVTLTTTEAELIGKHVGRKPKVPQVAPDVILTNQSKYRAVPCPFLKKGKCSIYEVRPLACRIHFNMADTAALCDTSIPATIPMLDNRGIDAVHFKAFRNDIWADIRDFFPIKPA
jgi:Fe-S-cluster containining protein